MAKQHVTNAVRAVFFDAVGTLLHPADPVVETYRTIAHKHGLDLDEATIRSRIRDSFARQEMIDQEAGWRTSEERELERWRTIVRETLRENAHSESCFQELWDWYREPRAWSLPVDADRVLNDLSGRGLVIGMASNFDARLAGIVERMPGLSLLADRCVISSLVGWRKPAPEFFHEVARVAGCAAGQILFVGDDYRNDYTGARAAGMRALHLDAGGKSMVAERITRLSEIIPATVRSDPL
ncbi:MAG: HAD family hydrolase [Planctomycetes bacterium]|nr:HAD family hydrolase [Planctomycetota bacterium]